MPDHTTVNVDIDQHAVARAAVRLVRYGDSRPYTMRQFVREALADKIARIAAEYNDGKEIEPDEEPLETGHAV